MKPVNFDMHDSLACNCPLASIADGVSALTVFVNNYFNSCKAKIFCKLQIIALRFQGKKYMCSYESIILLWLYAQPTKHFCMQYDILSNGQSHFV